LWASSYIKSDEFLGQKSDYWPLTKRNASWSWLHGLVVPFHFYFPVIRIPYSPIYFEVGSLFLTYKIANFMYFNHLTEGNRPLGRPSVDGRIILRWIFRKWDLGAWTGSICLGIGTDGRYL
jgi:hypothetical protein